MTESELKEILNLRLEEGSADLWSDLLLEQNLIGVAMDLALGEKTVVPFRAAYALERAFLKAPERFVPYYERFTEDFVVAAHLSVWRHYGKIMAMLLKKERLALTDLQVQAIAEAAVVRLVDEQVPVGARVWSLDILYYLRGRLGWIDRELPAIIDDLKVAPTPAMVSRLRRYGWVKK